MGFDALMDGMGEQAFVTVGGLAIGIAFGAVAQRSRFCLRTACLEVAHGRLGERLAVWLLAFSAALIGTQGLILLGQFDTGSVRQLNNLGSLSGSVIGGLMFGCGMALCRACAGRMLVLTGSGNLRTLLSGLVFAVAAQTSRSGILEPARAALGQLWTIDSSHRDLLAITGAGNQGALLFGVAWLAAGVVIGLVNRLRLREWACGVGVGLVIAATWWFTYQSAARAFEPVPVHAISFTSPSADVLMKVLSPPGSSPWTFDIGLVPGVVLGAFLAGLWARDLKLEGFKDGRSMFRYIIGGCLMGFGSVLAGGCAIGAGVSGASVFALTAWLVLWSMWVGAVITDYLVDRRPAPAEGIPVAAPEPTLAG